MAWTQSDVDALEAALKLGIRSVQYSDRSVTYHSLDEMLRLREAMRQSVAGGGGSISTTLTQFWKA